MQTSVAYIRLPGDLHFERQRFNVLIDRLSATQCSLQAFDKSHQFAAGSEIGVTLDLPPPFSQIECRGRVEWSGEESGLATLHLSFTRMSHADTRQIVAFVRGSPREILFIDSRPQLGMHAAQHDRTVWVKSAAEALEYLSLHEAAVLVLGQFSDMSENELLVQSFRLNSCPPATIALDAGTRAHTDFIVARDFADLSAQAQRAQVQALIARAVTDYCRRFELRYERTPILGTSRAMVATLAELAAMSRSAWSVHISGETGTGKELMARALHQESDRRGGPFVAFNCAGVAEGLLQATLFGHERGAYTGAEQARRGLFIEASGGTLFLDEIADCSPTVQASLLRVLQEREVTPLGSQSPRKVDVRIVSATNRNLEVEMHAGRFRSDLFYRLFVLHLSLPPLRERGEDIAQLAEHFIARYAEECGRDIRGLSEAALHALQRYPWPGNVRELQNEMQRAIVCAKYGGPIELSMLSPNIREAVGTHAGSFDDTVNELERGLVEDALKRAEGNVSQAATLLGIDKSRLAKMKRRLGI